MARRLTDRQRKKIIAERADGASLRHLAAKYRVSDTTIRRVLKSDPEMSRKVAQKKEQNTADIIAYMEEKKNTVCEILGKGLDVLNDREKLAEATPSQITTALGTLIDKWTGINAPSADTDTDDPLSRSLYDLAKELRGDE